MLLVATATSAQAARGDSSACASCHPRYLADLYLEKAAQSRDAGIRGQARKLLERLDETGLR
jgi:hypothetical protein